MECKQQFYTFVLNSLAGSIHEGEQKPFSCFFYSGMYVWLCNCTVLTWVKGRFSCLILFSNNPILLLLLQNKRSWSQIHACVVNVLWEQKMKAFLKETLVMWCHIFCIWWSPAVVVILRIASQLLKSLESQWHESFSGSFLHHVASVVVVIWSIII